MCASLVQAVVISITAIILVMMFVIIKKLANNKLGKLLPRLAKTQQTVLDGIKMR